MRPLRDNGFHASAQHAVYLSLREAIITHALRPGEPLQAMALAARLGVSATPVREALIRLSADGLAVYRPNRGAVVAPLSAGEVRDLYEVRAALEGLAAGLAAKRASAAEVAALEALARRMRRALADRRHRTLLSLNQELHRAIAAASGNPLLADALRGVHDRTRRFQNLCQAIPSRLADAYTEHLAIIAAIAGRDAEAASRLARRNVLAASAAVAGYIEGLSTTARGEAAARPRAHRR